MTTIPFRDSSLFVTQGHKEHINKIYTAQLEGEDWQGLVTFLESAAEKSSHFPEIAQLTVWALRLRSSLKDHGW